MQMKPVNVRKGRAFRGARERIVRTDIALDRTEAALYSTKKSLDASRNEVKGWEDLFQSPMMREFGDQISRDIGRQLSSLVAAEFEKLISSDEDLKKFLIGSALDKLVRDTGDNLGAVIRDMFLGAAEIDVKKVEDNLTLQEIVYTRIMVPAQRYHFNIRLD